MRKLIVPTDFSENAFNALRYTVELFKHEKSEIHLLHAYAKEAYATETSFTDDSLSKLKEKPETTSTVKLAEAERRIKEFSPNPKHNFKLLPSNLKKKESGPESRSENHKDFNYSATIN